MMSNAFIERAITNAKNKFPDLGAFGFGKGYEGDFDHAQIETAYAFLQLCQKTKRPTVSSYAVKHYAENWGRTVGLQPYVSNGAAALAAGFVVERVPGYAPCNAGIGISKRDIETILRRGRP